MFPSIGSFGPQLMVLTIAFFLMLMAYHSNTVSAQRMDLEKGALSAGVQAEPEGESDSQQIRFSLFYHEDTSSIFPFFSRIADFSLAGPFPGARVGSDVFSASALWRGSFFRNSYWSLSVPQEPPSGWWQDQADDWLSRLIERSLKGSTGKKRDPFSDLFPARP